MPYSFLLFSSTKSSELLLFLHPLFTNLPSIITEKHFQMPGTIQVSVLDVVGLSSSSIFVKISMGKKEYQSWGKGDFSFPLSALRDCLIVTLHDEEGNEICRKGVETRSIVEKGVLDDLISLEGGGHLHIKFQFILTEEDRKRIREMRESALRRKHGELLTSSIRHSRSMPSLALPGGDIVSSSIPFNNDIADSHGRADQTEAVSVNGNRERIHVGQSVQTSPNDTDGSENTSSVTPLAQELNFHLTEANQRNATHTPAKLIPSKQDLNPRLSGPVSSVVKKYGSVSNTLDEDRACRCEKQSALEKTPSNVKSMINAFESGLHRGSKQHDNESKTKFPSKNSDKELKMEKTNSIQSNADTGLRPSFKGLNSNERINSRTKQREEDINLEESVGPSVATTGGNLRRANDVLVSTDRSHTAHGDEQDSGLNVLVESKWKTWAEDLNESYPENKNYPHESSGNCVFLDETRRLCITTGSQKVMDLYGKHSRTEKRASKAEQKLDNCTHAEVKKKGNSSHSSRKQKLESSQDDNFHGGIIGQAVRIAIMVAFGTLVLVTRQRINR